MKFDKKYADGKVIVLDTETIGLKNRLVYNMGWCVKDADGNIFKRDYLVKEIIELPIYEERYYKKPYFIRKPSKDNFYESTEIKTFAEILDRFFKDNADGIVPAWAYNSPFDSDAILSTIEYLNIDLNAVELEYLRNLKDILPLAKKWFKDNDLVEELAGADGKVHYTVENVVRYFYKNDKYMEKHQALYDSEDEMFILSRVTNEPILLIPSNNFYNRWFNYIKLHEDFDSTEYDDDLTECDDSTEYAD